ncbi:MAG: TadE/TadG family type IV pilus assembly protein [Alphaproteobacteria bacterium]|jgi:hypothetical protein|nr:TadE/TadG family type IV pilus assembly protein [Alphaproteobacteria bacterium]
MTRRGQASTAKTALLLAVALLVLAGALEFGSVWYTRQAMFSAAREAAKSFIRGDPPSIEATARFALDRLRSDNAPGAFTAQALISDGDSNMASISVVVSIPAADAAMFGVLPSYFMGGDAVSATASMRLETPEIERPSGWWRYTVSGAGHGPKANQ